MACDAFTPDMTEIIISSKYTFIVDGKSSRQSDTSDDHSGVDAIHRRRHDGTIAILLLISEVHPPTIIMINHSIYIALYPYIIDIHVVFKLYNYI